MEVADAILEKTKYNQLLTNYATVMQSRTNKSKLKEFADFRKFSIETVNKCGIFYVGEMAEMLVPAFLDNIQSMGIISETNYKPIFRERWVIPIKDTDGLVQNFVGYSPNADERYIYGTSRYYRRKETLYGLENLKLAYDMGYAIVTEGITDTIRMRDMGYPNTFAMCGTHKSDFMMRQLNRCRHGIIKIPDRDNPGLRALKGWKCHRSLTLMINMQYKDVDEMCREGEENQQWLKDYMTDCINWIKSDEHHGQDCLSETVTVL